MRLIVIDGHRSFREMLEKSTRELEVLEVSRTAPAAEPVFGWTPPLEADLALIDIDLPDQSGFEVARWLHLHDPSLATLMVAGDDWDVYLIAARSAQTAGVISRSSSMSELIPYLVGATRGPVFTPDQLRRMEHWKRSLGASLTTLSPREWQVLWLAGETNQVIARELSVQVNTVEKHMTSILQKLNLPSRTQLVQFIYSHHLNALKRMGARARFFV